MSKMLKIYADAADIGAVAKSARIVEQYDAFVLAETNKKEAALLARKFPVEDITDQYQLKLGSRTVDTKPRKRAPRAGSEKDRVDRPLKPGPHHYIVQFVGPVKQEWLAAVGGTGARLRDPMGNFAYIVLANAPALEKISRLPFVRWVGHLPFRNRVSTRILGEDKGPELPRRWEREGVYTVEIFDSKDAGRIARAARSLGFEILLKEPKTNHIVVQTSEGKAARKRQIEELAAVHGVRYIRERVVPRPANNIATALMGNKYAALSPKGLNLTSEGEIIAVCDTGLDTGDPNTIHPDFAGRVKAIKSYPVTTDWKSSVTNVGADDGPADLDSGHGTHVCGSVLGNGKASNGGPDLIRGHSYKAKLVFQAVEQEMKWKPDADEEWKKERYALAGIPTNLAPLFQFAYSQGARIHSNSWGGGDPGSYDDQCRQFDRFVWDHKDFCFVVAAGNDGTDNDGDGKINLMSVSSPATAKNCITVGACENVRPEFNAERYGDWWPTDFPSKPIHTDPMADNANQVVAFSSRGPTKDNRIKPDVVAPGTFILSTRSTKIASNNFAWKAYPPNKKYFFMGGTSMATPLTAGAVGLLREFLRKKRGISNPSAALLKALLIAGAERLPKTADSGVLLDPHQGFGRVNLDRSLKKTLLTVDGPGLQTGGKSTTKLKVSSSGGHLRIAMCYSDYPGGNLINNLNLIVSDPNGKRYVGNQPTKGKSGMTLDATNNVEVVEVPKAKGGTWTIDVVAGNVPSGPQDFALVAILV